MSSEIGLIGLGVMGKSLSRNLAQKGFQISLFNRHVEGKEEDVAINFKKAHQELESAQPFDNLEAFVQSLETPRKIILMVNAGSTVDLVLNDLNDLLDAGDIVVDGGNSHFEDTNRRINTLNERGLVFIGTGISGGEEGALRGPSIMPSGKRDSYLKIQKFLEAIAAKDTEDRPCCTYIGTEGSGHFVKMIHNGIEYVEMQLLAECYAILKRQGESNEEIANVFESWSKDLGSYLLSITIDILRKKEGDDYLLDKILDKAGNKGTGNWATVSIADSGQPATLIPAALFARYLSFFKSMRVASSSTFTTAPAQVKLSYDQLKDSYQFARIMNHNQGFTLIHQVSEQNGWSIELHEVARIWTSGCIIKSDFMKELVEFLKDDFNLLKNSELIERVNATHKSIKSVVSACISTEVHAPCLIESVNYFHGLKTADSPANLIQAQRDYFGAHTYQRIDDSSEKFYHTEW